jgi:hypothetical protein
LTYKDILIFNHNLKSKAFLIREVKQVQFRKGSNNTYIKTDFDEELKNFDILDSNFKETLIQSNNQFLNSLKYQSTLRGINKNKFDVLKKLSENLDQNSKSFYNNLFFNDILELKIKKDSQKFSQIKVQMF